MKRHLRAGAVTLTGALLALQANAGYDEAAQQAIGELWQKQLLAPLPQRSSAGQVPPVAFPEMHRQRLLENVAGLSLDQLDQTLGELLPTLHWGYATAAATQATYDIDLLAVRFGRPPLDVSSVPEWLAEALAHRVRQLSLTHRAAKRPPARLGWLNGRPDGSDNRAPTYDELSISAMAWAGPAVRDNAHYVEEGDRTRIRIDRTPYRLSELAGWAHQRGLALSFSLDTSHPLDTGVQMPILAKLEAPVWLVTSQGLVPARLTGMHTGNRCLGGGWLELEVDGNAKPAIWAILFLPDKGLATSAVVKRQTPPAETDAYLVAARSQLSVSWPDQRLTSLTLTAKRFDWRNYPQRDKETPPILGTAWGTYIETVVPGEKEAVRLSAAGTPECALQ